MKLTYVSRTALASGINRVRATGALVHCCDARTVRQWQRTQRTVRGKLRGITRVERNARTFQSRPAAKSTGSHHTLSRIAAKCGDNAASRLANPDYDEVPGDFSSRSGWQLGGALGDSSRTNRVEGVLAVRRFGRDSRGARASRGWPRRGFGTRAQ